MIVLCWFWLFSAVQPIFTSCQRAERRERSERCEAPGLLLVIFGYFWLFLVVFGCFVIVWVVFGYGRVWEPLGRCWALPGLLYAVFRDFLYFYNFLRRQRAERRERSERCEAPGLLLVIFRYLLLFLVVFKSSALALHASTTLICIRASRSLLRQVFLLGSGRSFFRFFFEAFFHVVFQRFFLGFWRGFGVPNGSPNQFWRCFLQCFFGGRLGIDFLKFLLFFSKVEQ